MPRSVLQIAALLPLLPLLSLACASAGPRPVTPVRAWSLPEGCASSFYPDSFGRIEDEDKGPALIKDSDELEKHVKCREGFEADFDFDVEWIAMFPVLSENGHSFKALSIEDDGTTLTLDIETHRYCGGTRPNTKTETFFYRVPQRERALAIKLVPAEQPPCPRNLP